MKLSGSQTARDKKTFTAVKLYFGEIIKRSILLSGVFNLELICFYEGFLNCFLSNDFVFLDTIIGSNNYAIFRISPQDIKYKKIR